MAWYATWRSRQSGSTGRETQSVWRACPSACILGYMLTPCGYNTLTMMVSSRLPCQASRQIVLKSTAMMGWQQHSKVAAGQLGRTEERTAFCLFPAPSACPLCCCWCPTILAGAVRRSTTMVIKMPAQHQAVSVDCL